MVDWAAKQITVYEGIKSKGFAVTISKPGSQGDFDPDTLEWSNPTEPVNVETYAIRKEYDIKEIDGTIVEIGDCILVTPAYGLPATLDTTYQILIGSDAQNVVNIFPVSPGNVPLLYNIQVRT